jgi:cell division septal protein FtsQ
MTVRTHNEMVRLGTDSALSLNSWREPPEHRVLRWLTLAVIVGIGLIAFAFWLEAQLEKRARTYETVVRATWVSVPGD